jgi:hypothetical protein
VVRKSYAAGYLAMELPNPPENSHLMKWVSRSLRHYWAAFANSAGMNVALYRQFQPMIAKCLLALDLQTSEPRRIC